MTAPGLTAQAVADLVGGRLLGDGEVLLRGVGPLDRAGPEMLSFATGDRYAGELRATSAGAVLVSESLADLPAGCRARIVVADPYGALSTAMRRDVPAQSARSRYRSRPRGSARAASRAGTSPSARTPSWAAMSGSGDRCRVAEGVSLGDGVIVGEDSVLGPRVVCYAGTRVGKRVVLKAGAVIGGDGFGYLSGASGT